MRLLEAPGAWRYRGDEGSLGEAHRYLGPYGRVVRSGYALGGGRRGPTGRFPFPDVLMDVCLFSLGPGPRGGSLGRVRTAIFLWSSMILGRFRPRSWVPDVFMYLYIHV